MEKKLLDYMEELGQLRQMQKLNSCRIRASLLALILMAVWATNSVPITYAAPGDFDLTFGVGGVVTDNLAKKVTI